MKVREESHLTNGSRKGNGAKEMGRKWGQIFILDIAGWRRDSMRFLLKQTESKVKDKDLTPIVFVLAGWRRDSMRFLLKQTESKVKDKDLTPIVFVQRAYGILLPLHEGGMATGPILRGYRTPGIIHWGLHEILQLR